MINRKLSLGLASGFFAIISSVASAGTVQSMSKDALVTIDTKDGHLPLTMDTHLMDKDVITVHRGSIQIVDSQGQCAHIIKTDQQLEFLELAGGSCGQVVTLNTRAVTGGAIKSVGVGSSGAPGSIGAGLGVMKLAVIGGGLLVVAAMADNSKSSPD